MPTNMSQFHSDDECTETFSMSSEEDWEQDISIQCCFCDACFDSTLTFLDHAKLNHEFDFIHITKTLGN